MESKTLTTVLALLLVVVALVTLVRFTQQYGLTGAATAQTNLTINSTCGIALNATGNLTFGQTYPNTTYNLNNITINYSNTGNYQQNVSINSSVFYVNDTGVEGELQCNQTRYTNNSTGTGFTPINWEQIGAQDNLEGRGICAGNRIEDEGVVGTINRIQPNQSYVGAGGGSRADNNTTFKINIPSGTKPGRYHTNVTYIAEC